MTTYHKNSRRRFHSIMSYQRSKRNILEKARWHREGFISGLLAMLSLNILFALIYYVFTYSNK